MTNLRHNPKRDANEPEIVAALEQLGASVERLNGKDIPDLLIGFRYRNFLAEVKSDHGTLSPGQIDWHSSWRGQVVTLRSAEDATSWFQSITRIC